jgi:TolB-like protein/tetratricopeptide (TPR) repeat protein
MTDVFVSYSRTDKALVVPLVAALEAQGWSVWWDPAISPGQEFDREIATELDATSAVLVVWTPQSVESRWVRGEARDGADRGILIPVRFGNARLPIDFRAFHTIDLDEKIVAQRGAALQETVRALQVLVARRQPAQAAPGDTPVARPNQRAAATVHGAEKISICVLPFANLSGDPEQQVFSDGIAEDVIRELSRWRSLSVRSRSASFRFRGGTVDVAQVARELRVRYVVDGSVRRIGDRIRVSVELIDAESGSQVWGERFDRAQSELFAVQDQVVQRIVSTLVGRVQVSDVERARRKPPASLDAYECVLQGNALPWDDPAASEEATRLFKKATELDPGYGLAYALLATMHLGQWRNNDTLDDASLDEAYELAKRSVELDDGESTCHSLLAFMCLYRRSFELALQHMRRAVEINPNNPWNMADMGCLLSYVGQAQEAIAWFARAREVDPYFDPPWAWRQAGQSHMALRQYDQALSMFAHIPIRSARIWAYMSGCHARLGNVEQARVHAAGCLRLQPEFSIARFMTREPFRHVADAEHLVETLRLAALPE